jgi:tetratricopeptide (TPR) repeat protein
LQLAAAVLAAQFDENGTEVAARVEEALRTDSIPPGQALEWLAFLQADDACLTLLKQQIDPKQPATLSRYILFLAGHQRVAEAMSELSQLWKSDARETAIGLAASLAALPDVSPSDLEPVRKPILQMAESAEAPVRLLLAAAALEDEAGDYEASIGLYRRVLAAEPDHVVALNNLAFIEAIFGSGELAAPLANIRHALDIAGPNDQLLDTEGVVLLRRGEAAAAAERFSAARDQRADAGYQVHLGWALVELGRLEEAAQAFEKADAAKTPPRLHALEKPLDSAWRARLAPQ